MNSLEARDEKGRYIADDKSTPDVNVAYTRVRKSRKTSTKKK